MIRREVTGGTCPLPIILVKHDSPQQFSYAMMNRSIRLPTFWAFGTIAFLPSSRKPKSFFMI